MAALGLFCASSIGTSARVQDAAREVGRELAHRGLELVYGGGKVGLMGIVADAVLEEGGRVTGVMTRALSEREIAHTGLSELHVVESMHERKLVMSNLADGFIALPGGAGTFEEIFEQWTWAQLGIHQKPCGFLEVDGFFDPLRTMIEHMRRFGYLAKDHAKMIVFDTDIALLLDRFQTYSPPVPKWQAPATIRSNGTIRIAAAVMDDDAGCLLLVRKVGTRYFMQPGGKVENNESPLAALARELREEIGFDIDSHAPRYLGQFSAEAANEPGWVVQAELFHVRSNQQPRASAEIAEAIRVTPAQAIALPLAPLTRDHVLPLIRKL